MDPVLGQIITSMITVAVPALVTVFTTKSVKKQANKHSTRSDIMQLIMEDHVRDLKGCGPENYQTILNEFDEYKANGGEFVYLRES